VQIEVAQQTDLGQVMDQLAVDVQHQIGHGRLGEGLVLADRDPEPSFAEAAHPGQPDVELGFDWSSTVAALPAYSQLSYDAADAPKCAGLRAASTPTMT
jgi:hypothetical protein